MKKCVKCGNLCEGNFCVKCGGKLIDDIIITNEEKEQKNNLSKPNIVYKSNLKWIIALIIAFILLIVAIVFIGYKKFEKYEEENNSLEFQNGSLNIKVNDYKKKIDSLQEEINQLKEKTDFLDKNIVFVLDGYGNYYYTYDQVVQVTNGKSFSYWAYNKDAAKSQGYKAWK